MKNGVQHYCPVKSPSHYTIKRVIWFTDIIQKSPPQILQCTTLQQHASTNMMRREYELFVYLNDMDTENPGEEIQVHWQCLCALLAFHPNSDM